MSMGSYEDRRGGPFEEPLTGRAGLANFHLGWFTKKAPHKSPKYSVFPTSYDSFLGLARGLFWGPTQVEN